VVVDSPLEKERGGNEESDNPYATEELGADAVFEGSAGFGKAGFGEIAGEVRGSGFCGRICGRARWRGCEFASSEGWGGS